ncbi:MAG: NUDIX domain-containing protein [Leptospiraceae bacterium]|nr:NUDIX domain-containing protein [Leptospiraceae bacterium]
MKKNSFCSFCGNKFSEDQKYPRECAVCRQITYINPIPVCVMIVPVGNGILGVKRGIEPGKGMPALPGGFIDGGETWQEGGAREVWEEVQVKIDPNDIKEFFVESTEDKRLILIFGISSSVDLMKQPEFQQSLEAEDRLILNGNEKLAFPLHELAMRKYFKLFK